jgi:hypothetical protein
MVEVDHRTERVQFSAKLLTLKSLFLTRWPMPRFCYRLESRLCAKTEKYAVCKAFSYYGKVDPEDEWLPEFQCFDGLTLQMSGSPVAEENCN